MSSPALKHKPRPFSIDLSLELERQLESESLPTSPANADTPARDSLDPTVLAHIVMTLRQSLQEMTKERDDLLALLSSAHSKEAELNDALQHMTDKATGMEEELTEARKKMKDDEEAISMLRSKVEESRRGLMRLQTENRRQSMQPIDVSRASIPLLGSPPSSKRASFTPLTGTYNARANGHKRGTSVSDSHLETDLHTQTLTVNDTSSASSRRFSGLFGRGGSPPQDTVTPKDSSSFELESIKKELSSVKAELEDTRHELSEAIEAREASESCVKTLREFISENSIGVGNVDSSGAQAKKQAAASWGFNLWKVDTSVKAQNGPASADSSHSPDAPDSSATPTVSTPLSRKIGGFFSRQSSISSVDADTRSSLDVRSDTSSMKNDTHV
ncbi:hypothetical protein Moror_17437 [Moniliophthora roreri MCA 2997]|uniref:Uncharacterized protein n=2 Tax=Moniliophthora roreri TaxID=221103 RepID=V2XYZ7_MONRO|nr:hypothetical protein Moror_17437 [Moniliophthora roreri MCA 2997]KAI3600451.1 hypothetical protein WG66_001774 [Moniliophthora roreri]